MKLNMKHTARLAVSAGLCASLTLGGMPLPAIAAEIEEVKAEQAQDTAGLTQETAGQAHDSSEHAPAVDEAPAPQEAPAVEDAPDKQDAPAEQEAPVVEEAPSAESTERTAAFAGEGTKESPYIISTVADLEMLRDSVNQEHLTYKGKFFKIAEGATLDLSGAQWTSIGTPLYKFQGTLDGGGATIKGLTWSLFSGINGATIENLKLEVNIDATGLSTEQEREVVGALVKGALSGSCTIRGIEVFGSVAGDDYVGGVFGGRAVMGAGDKVLIEGCVNNATITSGEKGGGIAGYILNRKPANAMPGTVLVKSCVNNGTVRAQYAGGISGYVASTAFEGCANAGTIEGTLVAGGVVGAANSKTTITGCKNIAEVSCLGAAGGVLGSSSSGNNTVSKSANTASVTGVTNAGGIIGGSASAGDFVDNCYNGGVITATGDGESAIKPVIAGGIFGYNNSGCPVRACMNDGKIVANGSNVEKYQIGKSGYWYAEATGSKVVNSYYIQDGAIALAPGDGKGEGTPQPDMTRGELADALNTAGGVDNFWQAQNGTVQPDPLIPGAWDDEGEAVAEVLDANGDVVERYDSLSTALAAAKDGQTVKLTKGIEISRMLLVANKAVTLDLGGNEIKQTEDAFALVSLNGASLTVKNGVVTSVGSKNALYAQNASIATLDLQVNAANGFQIGNRDNPGQLDLGKGTVVNASDSGVVIVGPYDAASIPSEGAKFSRVVVNDGSKIVATVGYGISGNGLHHGTEVIVKGGEISSARDAAIYHPQAGTLTLAGGTVKGKTGVQMCSGDLVVPEDSTVVVVADGSDDREHKNDNDGSILDGAAISMVNRDYPGGVPTADIKGGTFKSDKSQAVLDYTWKDKAASEWPAAGESIDISGGAFSTEPREDLLAEGFGNDREKGEDGLFHVHEHVWADKLECNKDGHWSACTKCDEKTEAVPHVEKVVGAQDATYGKDGYTGDVVCAECGYLIKKGSVIPALGGASQAGKPGKPGKPAKPGKGDKLAQTGDASTLGVAAAGIAGISSALAGIFTARKRRDNE